VASTIVSVNGRHFLILLYSILICIVLDAPWSYLVSCFRSFKFEEEEQEVPSTTVANIHYPFSNRFDSQFRRGVARIPLAVNRFGKAT